MRAASLVQSAGWASIAVGFITPLVDGPDWLSLAGFGGGAALMLVGAFVRRGATRRPAS